MDVNRDASARKGARTAIAYFDEYEFSVVECNDVNFAKPAAEISNERFDASAAKVLFGDLFGAGSYSSRVGSGHASSSAASGISISAWSLRS